MPSKTKEQRDIRMHTKWQPCYTLSRAFIPPCIPAGQNREGPGRLPRTRHHDRDRNPRGGDILSNIRTKL